MAFRVGIFGLNTQGQTEQYGLSVFQLVGELLQTQQGAHACQQFFFVDRLAEEIVGAALDPPDPIAAIC